jgi:toxin ParE1/3/4
LRRYSVMPVARKLWQPMRMQMPTASAQRPITRKTSPCAIGLLDKRPARPASANLSAAINLKFEVKGTHELVIRPNYVIVYRVLQDAVAVLRVLHATQQWPAAKRR